MKISLEKSLVIFLISFFSHYTIFGQNSEKDYKLIIENCDYYLSISKDSIYYLYQRAVANMYLKKHKKSLEDLNVALSIESNNDELLFFRGYIKSTLGDHVGSIGDYDKAISLNPLPNYFVDKGVELEILGDTTAAIVNYSRSIQIDDENIQGYINRASAYSNIGKYQKSINDWERLIILSPSDGELFNDLGVIYVKINDFEKAIDCFNKAIKIDGKKFRYLVNLGEAVGLKGDLEKSLNLFDHAYELDSSQSLLYAKRARIYYEFRNYKLACEDIKKVKLIIEDDNSLDSSIMNACELK